MGPDVTLKIEATMPERWASQFLGMLQEMRRLGEIGSSRSIIFFSDGDGDFNPKFVITDPPPLEEHGIAEGHDAQEVGFRVMDGDLFFDAG